MNGSVNGLKRRTYYILHMLDLKKIFLKMLIDLAFVIPTLSLFHSFVQNGKNVLLKDFVLVGTGLIMFIKF